MWRIALARQTTNTLTKRKADMYRKERLCSGVFNTYRSIRERKQVQNLEITRLKKSFGMKVMKRIVEKMAGYVESKKQKRQAYQSALAKFE